MLASISITALAGTWIVDRVFKKKSAPDDTLHPMSIKKILTISFPMLMTSTMTFVIGQTGVIMLAIFRSDAEVGYYSVAVSLATLTGFVLRAINTIAAPKFSELFHSGRLDELFHVAQKSTKLIFWTTLPMLLTLLLLGKPILSLLYGPEFGVAYWAMVLLILGQFVNSISGSTGYFMNMTGNQNVLQNIIFTGAIINILLNILITPRLGLSGAAIAGMISLAFWNLYTLAYIKIKYGKSIGYLPLLNRN
jgi:O-antigen/teichoic acid export membrane protein